MNQIQTMSIQEKKDVITNLLYLTEKEDIIDALCFLLDEKNINYSRPNTRSILINSKLTEASIFSYSHAQISFEEIINTQQDETIETLFSLL